jgi:hypothetical protein
VFSFFGGVVIAEQERSGRQGIFACEREEVCGDFPLVPLQGSGIGWGVLGVCHATEARKQTTREDFLEHILKNKMFAKLAQELAYTKLSVFFCIYRLQ